MASRPMMKGNRNSLVRPRVMPLRPRASDQSPAKSSPRRLVFPTYAVVCFSVSKNWPAIETPVPAVGKPDMMELSEFLHLVAGAMNTGNGFLLNGFQIALVKRVTAVITDAILGPSAPPSLRLMLRRGLRAAIAVASMGAFMLKLLTLAASMPHMDFAHDLKADIELVSAVDAFLGTAIRRSLLQRVTAASTSVMESLIELYATTSSFSHLNSEHLDLVMGAATVLDLATSGPCLWENCNDLMRIGTAVSLSVAQRNAGTNDSDREAGR